VSVKTPLIESRELLWNLTLRELRGKYRRSFLGWTWSLLNPLSMVLIYSFVFSVVFGATAPIGTKSGVSNYALFLLTGIIPWSSFALTTNLGMSALVSNSGLVRKVSFQRETLIYAQSIFALVQFGIELALLTVFSIVVGVNPFPQFLALPVFSILLSFFSTGLALGLSAVYVYFRDLLYLWTIFVQMYFFVTPIFYDPDRIGGRLPSWLRTLMDWNPMNQFVVAFRSVLYDQKWPTIQNLVICLSFSLIFVVVGLRIFRVLNKRIAEEL
jgi:ABC-type polysaccharide/polyol phosphate export permease